MRAVWKSSVSQALAHKLWYDFYDLDHYIQKKVWQVLFDYIQNVGWDVFRDMEYLCCRELLSLPWNKVVALGWGTMEFERNRRLLLSQNHCIILLDAPLDILLSRVQKDQSTEQTKRNALTDTSVENEYTTIYNRRIALYKTYADFVVINTWEMDTVVEECATYARQWTICIPIMHFEPVYIADIYDRIRDDIRIKYIELRSDALKSTTDMQLVYDAIETCPRQCIVTNRNSLEWWWFVGTIEQSLARAQAASLAGAQYVDIELSLLSQHHVEWLSRIEAQRVMSFHDFADMPSLLDLQSTVDKMVEYWWNIAKIACMATKESDKEIIYELQVYIQKTYPDMEYVLIAMGALWQETRVVVPLRGSLLTFASLDASSAPWQMSVHDVYKSLRNI